MRTAVSFLIGCVMGATGVLLYLQQTAQLAIAAETRSEAAAPGQPLVRTPGPHRDPVLIPVFGVTSDQLRSTFTERRGGGRSHGAIDILAPRGTPVLAAVDGTIKKLFTSAAGGLTIYQYDVAEEKVYYYAHLDAYAPAVREGLVVKKGDVIGYVGTTGNAPPGTPHLHFSISVLPSTKEWWKGEAIDPYPVLAAR